MVRSISSASQALLDQNLGTEPAIIIEIQWVDGGSIYTYSDKDLNTNEGKILEVSGLDNTVVVQGVQSGSSGDTQQISVTLDDADGTIKTIIDSHDIHKEPAWVYQWFQGLDTSEKFLVFKGQISSPMQWNEGARTVSFDIITRIEDAEVGFSIEEGDFDFAAPNLIGKPWPLIFGTVISCPALKVRTPRTGILKTGFGIRDYMLGPKKEQAGHVCCSWKFLGYKYEWDNEGFFVNLLIKPVFEKDISCECKKRAIRCDMDLNIAAQSQFEYSTITIIDGEFFPQGIYLVLDIEGSKIGGTFNGTVAIPTNIFTVSNRQHPKLVNGDPVVPPIKQFACSTSPLGIGSQDTDYTEATGAGAGLGTQTCVLPTDCGGWGTTWFFNNIVDDSTTGTDGGLEQETWDYLSQFEEAGFFWADPGSEVVIDGDNELVYIANILPATIHTVKAWRTFSVSNLRKLTTVPNTYYTVRQSDFNGYTTTEIVLDRPLSSRGEGWEDDLFVTQTSSVGPNPVDIMEWLITKYTSFTWDSSFATVKTLVDNYPMNFMVPGRMNILQLLQEMAFQGRMALVLRDDQFHLIYLSEEPISDGTITEDDVNANSLVLDHTNTEDLVTKFVAEWRPDCSSEEPSSVILRYNVKRYGTQSETFDFYCYNIQELVIKSATFWLIRMANTWRKVICKTPINKLALESLDGAFVTLPDIANGTIKCRVETATYNSDDHTIDFVLTTPVRAGERDAFPFHYPAGISIEELHPTIDDIQFGNAGGFGPNVDVKPPEGHVLGESRVYPGLDVRQSTCESITGVNNRPLDVFMRCREDQGDQQPSDIDDIKPTVPLEEDNSVIPPTQSPVNETSNAELKAERTDLQQEGRNGEIGNQINNATNTGTGGTDGAAAQGGAGAGGNDDPSLSDVTALLNDLPSGDELQAQNKCHYSLKVFYFNPVTAVTISQGEDCIVGMDTIPCNNPSGCTCIESGKEGCVVGNQILTLSESFHFKTAFDRDQMWADVESIRYSSGTVGQLHPGFTVKTEYTPAGCETDADGSRMIGYDQDGGLSIVGYKGFMGDSFVAPDACTV